MREELRIPNERTLDKKNEFDFNDIKPFLSIVLIISTLLVLVFLKMEERRRGYEILLLTREHKNIVEEKRMRIIQLAKMTRPQNVEKVAQKNGALRKLQANQIIHLSGRQFN